MKPGRTVVGQRLSSGFPQDGQERMMHLRWVIWKDIKSLWEVLTDDGKEVVHELRIDIRMNSQTAWEWLLPQDKTRVREYFEELEGAKWSWVLQVQR